MDSRDAWLFPVVLLLAVLGALLGAAAYATLAPAPAVPVSEDPADGESSASWLDGLLGSLFAFVL